MSCSSSNLPKTGWITAHVTGTETSSFVWKLPMKPNVVNDFWDLSFTLNTTVLLANPAVWVSVPHPFHTLHLLADSWLPEIEISATMALFFFFQSNLANQKHPPLCADVVAKKREEDRRDGSGLVTPAVWHFWVILSSMQEVRYEGKVEAWVMSVRDSWVRGYL